MKLKRTLAMIALSTGLCFSPILGADIGLSAEVTTLGPGLSFSVPLCGSLNLRSGVHGLNYTYRGSESDVSYDFDLQLLSENVLLDWHPWHNGCRVSTGVVFNQNKVEMEARPTAAYRIGNQIYAMAEVGMLNGELSFNPAAPYVGLGWGNAVNDKHRWNFAFDLGVVFQGKPEIDLTATGQLAANPDFMIELERERREIEDSIDAYKYYPVISFGVSYRF